MRQRHASGSRFYLAVFQVDVLNLYPFEAILSFHFFVDFSSAELRKLSETPFVPVKSIGDKSIIRISTTYSVLLLGNRRLGTSF
jgi:hypothetical protein